MSLESVGEVVCGVVEILGGILEFISAFDSPSGGATSDDPKHEPSANPVSDATEPGSE